MTAWNTQELPYTLEAFQKLVLQQGDKLYRVLPWRNIDDPYAVLLSELMLQQTQVVRVLDRWPRFLKRFPSIDALASASTADVLDEWQGLGYNRRALSLKRLADICAVDFGGKLPMTIQELCSLPGIGQATAAGVMSFAYQQPSMYLETNVRTVFLHELFPDSEKVNDKLLVPLVQESCLNDDPRRWYYALLDYGAYLKKTQTNPSRRSAHHVKQSRFEGSYRQKRAELLRIVLAEPGINVDTAYDALVKQEEQEQRERPDRELFEKLVSQLVNEGFFRKEENTLVP